MASCLFYGTKWSARGRDLDGAIKDCQQALTLEPDSSYLPYLHCALGSALELKGDLQAALREYELGKLCDKK